MKNTDILYNDSFIKSARFGRDVAPCLIDDRFKPNSVVNMLEYKKQAKHNLPDFKDKLAAKINYSLNNYCHRSEDFVPLDNTKTNILFAGCSSTFGEGLPDGHNWPFYLKKKFIDNGVVLGQTPLLAFLGGNTQTIVLNIMRYVNNFGSPDYVYVMLPDLMRNYTFKKDMGEFQIHILDSSFIAQKSISDSDAEIFYDKAVDYINWFVALDTFCESKGIKLIATSWNETASALLGQLERKSFVFQNYQNLQDFIESGDYDHDFVNKLDANYLIDAADGAHPGILYNVYFAEKMWQHTQKLEDVVK